MAIHSSFLPAALLPFKALAFKRRAGQRRRPFGSRHGFSLVEVTIALGITAFSFLVIFGLMGVGLASFRQSKAISVTSQIAQQVFSQVAVTPFNTLIGNPSTPYTSAAAGNYYQLPNANTGAKYSYFDEQGTEVNPATLGSNPVYMVNVVVNPTPQFLQATTGTPVYNPGVATVVVQVAFNPGQVTIDQNTTTYLWTMKTATSGTSGALTIPIYNYQSFVAQGS